MSYADMKIVKNTKYLKLEPNVPKDIRLLEDPPVTMFKHIIKKVVEICTDGQDDRPCTYCAQGDAPRQKFVTNVYDHSSSKVLLWEFGTAIAEQLKNIAKTLEEQNINILLVDIKVEATGEGFDRKYTITPRMASKDIPKGLRYHKIEVGGLAF